MGSFARFNIYSTLVLGIFLFLSVSYFLVYMPYRTYVLESRQVEEKYIEKNKEHIKNEINRIISRFSRDQRLHEQQCQDRLRNHLLNFSISLDNYAGNDPIEFISKYNHIHGKQEIDQDLVKNEIFFAFNEDFTLLEQPSEKEYAELDLAPIQRDQIIQKLKASRLSLPGEVSVIQWPSRNQGKSTTLWATSRYIPRENIYVVIAMSMTQLEKAFKRRVLEWLSSVRFGSDRSGYFFIMNQQAKPLMIGTMDPAYNKDMSALPTPEKMETVARQFVDIARNGGGFNRFRFKNPAHDNDMEEKIAYVKQFPKWGWVIGTGFYISEIKSVIAAEKKSLAEKAQKQGIVSYAVVGLNLLMSLIVAYFVSRHIKVLEKKRARYVRSLEDYTKLMDRLCMITKSDLNGDITYANDNFCHVMGFEKKELIGQPHNIVRHPDVPKKVFKDMWETIQAKLQWQGIVKSKTKQGKATFADSVISPMTDEDGNITEYIAARYDITELLESRDEIELAFATDKLTSLNSRLKLIEDIDRDKRDKCLILFDIVDFKGINSEFGIKEGDQIIRHVSEAMVNFFVGENHYIYRLHSDVFALLSLTADRESIVKECKTFLSYLSERPYFSDKISSFSVTLVGGIACGTEDLINRADVALHKAKHEKQVFEVYHEDHFNQTGGRNYWINEVLQGLKENRILPHYQPLVNLETNRTFKFECLMRMVGKNGDIIPPGDFLPIIEQTSIYPQMTECIVEKACSFFADRTESFGINLSIDDLLRQKTVDSILTIAKKYNTADRMVIEVVETQHVHNFSAALKVLDLFNSVGMRVAIDDFGSGYANFSYLSEFPAHLVKIDGSLVKKINKDPKTYNLVKMLVEYAHNEGMEVVAEFVCDAEILQTVKELGCDYGQGYYFSKPLPADQIDTIEV
ncbi:MAG: EAL domain-containing protein [Thermodesulfobacteriota bacterium]